MINKENKLKTSFTGTEDENIWKRIYPQVLSKEVFVLLFTNPKKLFCSEGDEIKMFIEGILIGALLVYLILLKSFQLPFYPPIMGLSCIFIIELFKTIK